MGRLKLMGGLMKILAQGGSDIATPVLYWPAALPEGFLKNKKADEAFFKEVEKLEAQGEAVCFPCDGDGTYRLMVFVDELVEAYLTPYLREAAAPGHVKVRGVGYFDGMEHMVSGETDSLSRVEIPEGVYEAKLYAMEVPEEVHEAYVAEHRFLMFTRSYALGSAGTLYYSCCSNLAFELSVKSSGFSRL